MKHVLTVSASSGSLKEAKTQGVYRLEGKTYIVKDGDIMHILASR